MIIRYSRTPAIVTLTILLLCGVGFAFTRSASSAADAAKLAELQKAIEQPDAKPATWMEYGVTLQKLGQFSRAVLAYKQVLENNPFDHDARYQCCICVGNLGNADDFFKVMNTALKLDPKLAFDIIKGPVGRSYEPDARYKDFYKEAQAQSMD